MESNAYPAMIKLERSTILPKKWTENQFRPTNYFLSRKRLSKTHSPCGNEAQSTYYIRERILSNNSNVSKCKINAWKNFLLVGLHLSEKYMSSWRHKQLFAITMKVWQFQSFMIECIGILTPAFLIYDIIRSIYHTRLWWWCNSKIYN